MFTGSNRCPFCFHSHGASQICPHCKSNLHVALDDRTKDRTKVQHFIDLAEEHKTINPETSLAYFRKVLDLEPLHYETRITMSCLLSKFSEWELVEEILLPLVQQSGPSFIQSQQAFTNLSLAALRYGDPDKAEQWARCGLNLDGIGNCLLWENLIEACTIQCRYDEVLRMEKHVKRLARLHPGFHVCDGAHSGKTFQQRVAVAWSSAQSLIERQYQKMRDSFMLAAQGHNSPVARDYVLD